MSTARSIFSAASICILAVCLLLGCQLSKGETTGKVNIALNSGRGARTVLPVISVASYLISFSGPAQQSPVSTTQSNLAIELEVGTWSISVEGKDNGGNTVAVGGASGVVVTTGVTTPVSIALSAQSIGNGTIDVTVTWPTVAPVIDSYLVTVGPVGGTAIEVPSGTVTFTPGGTSLRYTEGKAAGSYQLSINLYSGTVLRAPVPEAVQVYGNLSSSATIALGVADFTLPPAAPNGLVVAEGLGELDLNWVDNSHVATSYEVDRSTDNVSFAVLTATLPPNTTSYRDTTARMGQSYWYRVAAANDLGSTYSTSASGKVEAPIPGGSGALTFSAVTSSSISASWQMAADNVSPAGALSYKVVCSLLNNVQTAADAQKNGTVVQDWTRNVATANATALSSGTLYYFNVLVKDEAGNIGAYTSSSQATSLRTYTTSFPLAENPVSENGNWISGGVVGRDWYDVVTTPGLAKGTDSPVPFSDPTAILTGTWGPNQTAQATVRNVFNGSNCFPEVELRLRSTLSAHSCTGYEINFSCLSGTSAYMQIVRWNGALGSFTYISEYGGAQYGVVTGDVVKATIIGNVINVYKNGILIGTGTDSTYATGNPGIGFDFGCGSNYADFGFTTFTASELTQL